MNSFPFVGNSNWSAVALGVGQVVVNPTMSPYWFVADAGRIQHP